MVFQRFSETGIPVKWRPATLEGGGALPVWRPLPSSKLPNDHVVGGMQTLAARHKHLVIAGYVPRRSAIALAVTS